MTRLLLTGATGFVGRATAGRLAADGHVVVAAVRPGSSPPPGVAAAVDLPDLSGETDWTGHLGGIDAVVHLAARVHVLDDPAVDPLAIYRRINRDATLALAEQAIAAGVPRFVFVSSIHVNGVSTTGRAPFTADDPPAPATPYAVSKREAEDGLRALAERHGIDLVILRPVLVCGAGAGGNLARLAALVRYGLPLPFGAVRNRRSMIHVDDLADLLATTAVHGAGAPILLAADPEPIATPAMIRAIAEGLERPARLVPVPPGVLTAAGRLTGRRHLVDQLCGSLEVDADATVAATGWRPARGVAAGLKALGIAAR